MLNIFYYMLYKNATIYVKNIYKFGIYFWQKFID